MSTTTAPAPPPLASGYRPSPPLDRSALPPGPRGPSQLVAMNFLLRPVEYFVASQRKWGDTWTMRLAPERTVVVTCDPAMVKDLFTGPPELLHAGKGNVVLLPLLGSRSVLLLDGAEHLRHRRLLLPPFHGERMRKYGEVMHDVAQRHIAKWPAGGELETAASMQAITLEIILRTVFGVNDPAQVTRWSGPMRHLLNSSGSPRRLFSLAMTARSRRATNGTRGPWAELRNELKPIDAMILAEVRARRAELESGTGPQREDVLSLLLAARDEEGEPLSDQELRDELITLLVAGHETTATALAWTLERITRTPHVLKRLYEEGGADDVDYIDAVCKEALRIRPVVPAAARELMEPMTLGGMDLPAGVVVAASITLTHRREDLYPDPEAFRPERFLGRSPGTYEWIPFGGGVRRCLGASFALFEMRAVMQAILRNVRLAPSVEKDEGIRRRLVTLVPAGRGRVTITPRTGASTSIAA